MSGYQLSPEKIAAAQQNFVAAHLGDEILQQAQNLRQQGGSTVSGAELRAYAIGQLPPPRQQKVAQALGQNLGVRRAHLLMLRNLALYHIGEAIAATSEVYPSREAQGCSIRIQSSQAESQQVYLIVEVRDVKARLPKVLVGVGRDAASLRLELPVGRNGIIQVLLSQEDDIVVLLKDPKTEVILL